MSIPPPPSGSHDQSAEVLERLEEAEELKLEGKYEEAIVILEELLLEDPENVAALEEISDNELSLNHFDRAEEAARQAIALDPGSYTGYYILGFLRSRGEAWNEATEYLRKANGLRSNNAEILRCLGWALFSCGDRAQGIVTLERALNLDSDSILTLCDLGVAYLQAQNLPKSKILFERALDVDPKNARAKECMQVVDRLMKLSVEAEPVRVSR
jgi:tetratricopeptide (TPR) repeat protein